MLFSQVYDFTTADKAMQLRFEAWKVLNYSFKIGCSVRSKTWNLASYPQGSLFDLTAGCKRLNLEWAGNRAGGNIMGRSPLSRKAIQTYIHCARNLEEPVILKSKR